jgi:hypothetical protein
LLYPDLLKLVLQQRKIRCYKYHQQHSSVIDAFAGNDLKHGLPKHEFDTEKSKRDETPLVQKDGELETCKDSISYYYILFLFS